MAIEFSMESLAFLVTLLILLVISSGFGSIFLTFSKTKALSNVTVKPIQRIITIFLALISLLIGGQFVTQVDSFGGRVIGLFGVTTGLIAIYRVIKK